MTKIGEMASEIRKGRKFEESTKGRCRQVPISSIERDGKIEINKTMPVKKVTGIDNYVIGPTDVVLSVDGTTNKVAMITKNQPRLVVGSTCVLMRFMTKENAKKVFKYLLSEKGNAELASRTKGAIIPHLTIGDIREIDVP